MKSKISLVVITKNEENNLPRLLKSANWIEDIVILDSGSQDGTKQVALSLGARVYDEPWRGFGPQKKRATELAKYDWILSLDADEEISEDLKNSIQNLISQNSNIDAHCAYKIARKSFYLNRWITHGGWYPDYQTRFFNRQFSNWNDSQIHEKVIYEKLSLLNGDIYHYVFQNMSDQVETNNRYSSLQANQLFTQGKTFSYFKLLIKPLSKFIECYFWKLGFLDGFAGFFIALSAGYSVFLKWSKLKELQDGQK